MAAGKVEVTLGDLEPANSVELSHQGDSDGWAITIHTGTTNKAKAMARAKEVIKRLEYYEEEFRWLTVRY